MTVVIPTFNRAAMLMRAVDSVARQTCPDWELVIVDDGSTDDTCALVEGRVDPRIRLVRRSRGGLLGAVRNAGVAAGRGRYVAFLDSDDYWLAHRLEVQLEALAASRARWCYADVTFVDENGRAAGLRAGRYRPLSGWIAADLLLDRTGACIDTWLVERSLFDEVGGFDETLVSHGDLDLCLRLAEAAEALGLPDVVAVVADHGQRFTRGLPRPHERAARVFRKALDRRVSEPLARLARRRWASHLARAGREALEVGDVATGTRYLWTALRNGSPLPLWLRSVAGGLRQRRRRCLAAGAPLARRKSAPDV